MAPGGVAQRPLQVITDLGSLSFCPFQLAVLAWPQPAPTEFLDSSHSSCHFPYDNIGGGGEHYFLCVSLIKEPIPESLAGFSHLIGQSHIMYPSLTNHWQGE